VSVRFTSGKSGSIGAMARVSPHPAVVGGGGGGIFVPRPPPPICELLY
jgi:hypothetical protein